MKNLDVFTVNHGKHWLKVGTAYYSHDGDLNVFLEALPVSGKLTIRERGSIPRSEAPAREPGPEDLVCPNCGSDKVQGTARIEVNSGKVLPGNPPRGRYFCPNCQEEFKRPETREEYAAREEIDRLTIHYQNDGTGRECWTDDAAWWECLEHPGCSCEGISVRHGLAPSQEKRDAATYVEKAGEEG